MSTFNTTTNIHTSTLSKLVLFIINLFKELLRHIDQLVLNPLQSSSAVGTVTGSSSQAIWRPIRMSIITLWASIQKALLNEDHYNNSLICPEMKILVNEVASSFRLIQQQQQQPQSTSYY